MYRYLMRLVQIFGAGNPDIHNMLERYGDAEKACAALDNGECGFLDEAVRKNIRYITLEKMQEVAYMCERNAVKLISIYDEEYPALLREIYNPPVLLFYRGSLNCLKSRCITAVGARKITPYISKLSYKVASDLAKRGVTIVSGMADGVDSTVMNACIDAGKPVAGVLACGIFYDYPRDGGVLRERVLSTGGIYMSELLPNASPSPDYFKARNRIMAGLSSGTAVFQAGPESGSLITAEYAVQSGRDVFCVPPPDISDVQYSAVVDFLRDGAIPLFNHDDILNFYRDNY